VLELAAGTGVLTRELLVAGSVTATDLNDAMVDLGRRGSGRAVATGRRAATPFADGRFDLVACQFGVMFVGKPAVFAEARRVLAPGGTVLVNTWAALDTHDFRPRSSPRSGGCSPTTRRRSWPRCPGYGLEVLAADVCAGGLRCVAVESVTLDGHAVDADLAAGYAGTPLRAEIAARGDLAAMTAAVAREMTARLGGDRSPRR
jgi:SAM-dependent methyltransferase